MKAAASIAGAGVPFGGARPRLVSAASAMEAADAAGMGGGASPRPAPFRIAGARGPLPGGDVPPGRKHADGAGAMPGRPGRGAALSRGATAAR